MQQLDRAPYASQGHSYCAPIGQGMQEVQGIVFADKHSNVINDALTSNEDQDADDMFEDMGDITRVYGTNKTTGVHSKVDDNETYDNNETTGVHSKITTGVQHCDKWQNHNQN